MSALRWVVRPGDASELGTLVIGLDPAFRGAAADGRAFVNGRRAAADTALREGDVVEIWDPHLETAGVEVLARRGDLVILAKPPGLPTEPDRRGARSVVDELHRALGGEGQRPHADSRLDVGVSGAVLCAVGPEGRRRVRDARASGRVHRVYVAIAAGALDGSGTWDAPIGEGRARGASSRSVPVAHGRNPEPARTRWRAIARAPRGAEARATLLRLEPETGRPHQLRVHAHLAGHPLFGDGLRGGPRSVVEPSGRVVALSRIALHALRVEVIEETGEPADERFSATAPVPADFAAIWKALDGAPAAWDEVDP